ncbi:tryptophan synthase subunit alpha [Brachybacterium sp. P6-10-X1]|uniref:tryptophan synthase subunit alpha n=1 Tax=Brachybacterium sp. P6-10-X1 TaxID=1903186 RepID=UPI000971928D|nr:tryptophan synthase subunit alpha [Brachybacterium sp. P6-10-X1]APX31683.1 tryptophan synthase subunit alpha [Brachybacterium sp. P6-10-X1]
MTAPDTHRLRAADVVDRARAEDRAALIGYLPVGYPDVDGSIEAARVLIDHGADMIELGLPYSDPVMDGPVIQRAASAALAGGVRTRHVLEAVEALSGRGAAILVMSYWNPVLAYGPNAFARDLAAAGGAGVITPDLIPDEGADWIAASEEHAVDRVFLVAPSSPPDRLAHVVSHTRGFVYAASTMGVTGTRASVSAATEGLVQRTRAAGAENVCVGLGVSNGEQAAQVGAYADGVIVGSAFVRPLLDHEGDAPAARTALAAVADDLRSGVERSRTRR